MTIHVPKKTTIYMPATLELRRIYERELIIGMSAQGEDLCLQDFLAEVSENACDNIRQTLAEYLFLLDIEDKTKRVVNTRKTLVDHLAKAAEEKQLVHYIDADTIADAIDQHFDRVVDYLDKNSKKSGGMSR